MADLSVERYLKERMLDTSTRKQSGGTPEQAVTTTNRDPRQEMMMKQMSMEDMPNYKDYLQKMTKEKD
jgi:hypothetical protein